MNIDVDKIDNIGIPGCYMLEVFGDPQWWGGILDDANVPHDHVLMHVPPRIINLIKSKKLYLIINSDREGGPMESSLGDVFQTTTNAIKKLGLPDRSVLIITGNKKGKSQYTKWLQRTGNPHLFDVDYCNHFCRIFYDNKLPSTMLVYDAIDNQQSLDFNSLNRTHRVHRAAHLYKLAKENLLDKGLISGNVVNCMDHKAAELASAEFDDFNNIVKTNFPKFIDGDWVIENAANQYNADIYKNTLISFITETQYTEDVSFLTEKVFKPITFGHPMIVLASQGTLQSLRELGFRTDWCGVDPFYNDIEDPIERFNQTHKMLTNWINTPRETKIRSIYNSMGTIEHNFNLIRSRDYLKEAITNMLSYGKRYFNDRI